MKKRLKIKETIKKDIKTKIIGMINIGKWKKQILSIIQTNLNQILNKVGALWNNKKAKNELIDTIKEQNENFIIVFEHLNNIDKKTKKKTTWFKTTHLHPI